MLRVLGVDPGLVATGYGAVDARDGRMRLVEAGVIRTSPRKGITDRLKTLHEGMRCVLKDLDPDIMVLETLYSHYRHPSTAILMGHARGVICLSSGETGVPLTSVGPTRMRKSVLSSGHGSKVQVQRVVQYHLHLKALPRPDDASDALALAISYVLMNGGTRHGSE